MTAPGWRTSSYSGNQGNCVEVAHSLDRLRDSKNQAGPVLPAARLDVFVREIKLGRFAR